MATGDIPQKDCNACPYKGVYELHNKNNHMSVLPMFSYESTKIECELRELKSKIEIMYKLIFDKVLKAELKNMENNND